MRHKYRIYIDESFKNFTFFKLFSIQFTIPGFFFKLKLNTSLYFQNQT